MKNVLKRVLSVFLSFCIIFYCSVVGFASAALSGVVFKAIGSYLVGKLADYVWDTATGPEAQAKYAADKVAVLSVIRDWCVENNYDPNTADFQQFIIDMYLEAPDNDEMTSRYGSDWGDLHSQVHPYFAKLSSIYQCGWEEAYNWIVDHYDDDITKLKPDGTVQIPSGDLSDFIDNQNTQYTPKNVIGKMSYRTDERFQAITLSNKYYNGYSAMDFYRYGKFLANGDDKVNSDVQDIYLMFFAATSDKQYLGQYQFHFMIRPNEVEHWYEDRDEFIYGSTLSVEYWDMVNGTQEAALSKVVIDDFIPCALILDFYSHIIVQFDNATEFYPSYSTKKYSAFNGSGSFVKGANESDYSILYDVSDFPLTSINGDIYRSHFKEDFSTHDAKCEFGGGDDFGYIASTTPILTTYNIDTTRIPANQIINITGDTIYDYSITNPDTGESTTINNYITNNYTYPVVDTPSEPSGGVGGNINVTGQVGVDITVSVPDININVNQGNGAGGSGTGINPDDILDGSSVDLDKYYDEAVSQASGVRSFLKQFFDFLPAELVGLICMLVAVAIVCRIFGR